jgi:putative flippase GtrA
MAVGALGFALQIAALTLLTAAGWPLIAATATAVEIAILHNFCWHDRWTWRDCAARAHWTKRLARYHASTAVTSIGANVIFTTALVEVARMPPIVANMLAVAIMSVVNFSIADRWVFARQAPLVLAALWVFTPLTAHAAPPRETLDAWNTYVARAETPRPGQASTPCSPAAGPRGESHGVPGGTIHHWSGCTLVRGASVEAIVNGLMHPGTPPPQEDVIESRVLGRSGDSLHVYLRIVRRTILTVTYDTEHEVTFSRPRAGVASSRSVATRIVEAGDSGEARQSAETGESNGRDRGFLWKLNSYWRYVQTNEGVRIELESISLSRDVPLLLRPVASPIIARVARESINRALEAVRSYFDPRRQPRSDVPASKERTSTPAASSPRRMAADLAAAPGASPCTHSVSTFSDTAVPSMATTAPSVTRLIACATASSSCNRAPALCRDTRRPARS